MTRSSVRKLICGLSLLTFLLAWTVQAQSPASVSLEFAPTLLGCSPTPLSCGTTRAAVLGSCFQSGYEPSMFFYHDFYTFHGEAGQIIEIQAETTTDYSIDVSWMPGFAGTPDAGLSQVRSLYGAHSIGYTFSIFKTGMYEIAVVFGSALGSARTKGPYTLTISCMPFPAVSRKRAALHPGSSPFTHAYVDVDMSIVDHAPTPILLLPFDTYGREDPRNDRLILGTNLGETVYDESPLYCFCTLPAGAGWFSLITLPPPGKFLSRIHQESIPGIVEYKYSFSNPWQGSIVYGDVSVAIRVDDIDHWSFTGGPVTSFEKTPSGAIQFRGAFLNPLSVRVFDPG